MSASLYYSGQIAQGQCGRCDGTVADTLGVMEFDTGTDTIIGNHLIPGGTGGDPFGSPDGIFIVLVDHNSGEVVRFLVPDGPGEKLVSEHMTFGRFET